MMRKVLFLFGLMVLGASLASFAAARADEEVLTLLPHAKHEYRFDYKGDRTQIDIVADAPEGVNLYVYTPSATDPVGTGARKGNGLHWSGKFNMPGTYRAVVENTTDGPILYSIAFLGESVSNVGQIIPDQPAPNANVATTGGRLTVTMDLPTGARKVTSPPVPTECTPANALPPEINSSLKLCANEIYPPLRIVGNNLGLFADEGHSAVINSAGRQFAVNMQGANNWIDGIVIQAAPDSADAGAFLCQYDQCVFPTQPNQTVLNGGLQYGGGILLLGSNNVVHGVTVRSGTIGVATVDGTNNVLVGNNLSDLNGWGSFNIRSNNSVFTDNTFNRDNHGCTTPDGYKFESGCETAGWVCQQCVNNLVAHNHCEVSGNCYYMSGERGLASNNNRFVGNYCAASPNNCFEFTFSKGNVLQDNIATAQADTGAACKYPFWIGGSTVYFGQNSWGCIISPDDSIADAIKSTDVPTIALALGNSNVPYATGKLPTGVPKAAAPTLTPAPTETVAPAATATPPPCNRNYRVRILFDWTKLTNWVECVSQPAVP